MLWWIVSMILYLRNTSDLQDSTQTNTIPIVWFWDKLFDTQHGWTAATYLSTFLIHLIVSVVEFASYFLFM